MKPIYPISLKVQAFLGSDLEPCVEGMIQLARAMDMVVTLDFNGITLTAHPNDSTKKIVDLYHASISKPS